MQYHLCSIRLRPILSGLVIYSIILLAAGLKNNKGALITDALGKPADPFQFGAGHLRPTKAADPGLIYDASYTDYLMYLCSRGVTNADPSFKCPQVLPKTNDLNYPSVAIDKLNGTVTVTRTVTNVGKRRSTYFASVKPPRGYKVKILPSILKFRHRGQKRSFKITVEKDRNIMFSSLENVGKYEFGWLTWFDGIHSVRSPMVVSSA